MDNDIIKLLGIPNVSCTYVKNFENYSHDLKVKKIQYDHGVVNKIPNKYIKAISGPYSVLGLKYTIKEFECPCCHQKTKKIHDYRHQFVRDLSAFGKYIFLDFLKPRYHCDICNKNFIPEFDFLPRYGHVTARLNFQIISSFTDTSTLAHIAREFNVSVSKVQNCLKIATKAIPKELPEHLGIDEFKGNAFENEKYQVILTDLDKGTIFDILPSRKKEALDYYFDKFENKDNVKLLVMDMTSGYNSLTSKFRNAKVVVDHFHVCKYMYKALNDVRIRIQRNMSLVKNRKYFKLQRYVLCKPNEKLTDRQKSTLARYLSYNNDLYAVYYLKEHFREFDSATTVKEAESILHKIRKEAEDLNIPELDDLISIIKNWFREIVNFKKYGFTNAFTEGKNNLIKVVKRVGFGYRNFETFRKRILLLRTDKNKYNQWLVPAKEVKKQCLNQE